MYEDPEELQEHIAALEAKLAEVRRQRDKAQDQNHYLRPERDRLTRELAEARAHMRSEPTEIDLKNEGALVMAEKLLHVAQHGRESGVCGDAKVEATVQAILALRSENERLRAALERELINIAGRCKECGVQRTEGVPHKTTCTGALAAESAPAEPQASRHLPGCHIGYHAGTCTCGMGDEDLQAEPQPCAECARKDEQIKKAREALESPAPNWERVGEAYNTLAASEEG